MNSPARRETKPENLAALVASVSYTAAYVLVLREVYSWWVVAPVVLFALPIATMLAVIVIDFAGTWVGRLVCLAFGAALLWAAAMQADRTGSALMGTAFVISAAAARHSGRWL